PAPPADAAEPPAAPSRGEAHPRLHGCERLRRRRDADPHQGDAGRRARLSGSIAYARRTVLRAAAVAAAVQAAADDVGARSLLSDRALLPRRGFARGSSAGIHAARRRDVVPDAAAD